MYRSFFKKIDIINIFIKNNYNYNKSDYLIINKINIKK